MTNQTIINSFNGFEVFLEGVKVPYSGIRISESEGQMPNASITMSATSASFRVLPGTIVQVFGPDPSDTDLKIILFEGFIMTMSYSKRSSGGRQISFNCASMLSKWDTIRAAPKDAIMTKDYSVAVGKEETKYVNVTDEGKEQTAQDTNIRYAEAIKASKEKIESELYGELKSIFNDISLSQKGDFSDEIIQLFDDEKISGGDLDLFIKFFLKKFELLDLFYGIDSLSLGISDSVLTFPNVGKIDPFKFKAVLENTFNFVSSMKDSFKDKPLQLVKIISDFLQTLHYTQINPASFTSTLPFWTPNKEFNEETPVRSYFSPNLENSPPAKCNLFFPHDVTSLSYSRNMMQEPTRTIGQTVSMFSDGALSKYKGLRPFATEPVLNVTEEGAQKNRIGFTTEESYRGIIPNIKNFSSFFAQVEQEEILGKKETSDENSKEKYLNFVKPPLNQLTLNSHNQKRLSSKNISLQTSWNPYRLIGVPGAVIGDDGEPSFTGVVSAVTTRINASGQAVSTVALRAARVIYDLRDLNKEGYGDLINDFTMDPYIDTNSYLFDKNLYSFRNIGYTLYPVFTKGTLTSIEDKKIFQDYAKEKKAFSEGESNMESIYTDKLGDDNDYSILDILRDENGAIQNRISIDLTLEEEGDIRNSTQYTRDVYESIYHYKDLYESIKEGDGEFLKGWTESVTKRKIITKEDYFSYIGISVNNGVDSPQNYKDTSKILVGTDPLNKVEERIVSEKITIKDVGNKNVDEIKAKISSLQGQIDTMRARVFDLQKKIGSINDSFWDFVTTDEEERQLRIFKESQEVLAKKINELKKEKGEFEAELEPKEREIMKKRSVKVIPQFENDLFKPYNLIRKRHIEFSFSRQIKAALDADEDSESISHNIDLVN